VGIACVAVMGFHGDNIFLKMLNILLWDFEQWVSTVCKKRMVW
jgi:hypothetical protein